MNVYYIIIVITIMNLFSVPAFASMYSWTDENGVRHFSNNKPAGPETVTVSKEIEYDAEKDKQRLEKADDFWNEKLKAHQKRKAAKPRKKAAATSKEVVMFSTKRCGYCHKAKAFFNKHGIRFTEIDINSSPEGRKRFKKLNGRGVPLILIGNQTIRGFNKPAIKNALGL